MRPSRRDFCAVASAGLLAAGLPAFAKRPTPFLERLLAGKRGILGKVHADAATYRAQALVSVVKKGARGERLDRHHWRTDAEYFYPASALKTCAAISALQRLTKLQRTRPDITVDTPLRFYPAWEGDRGAYRDQTNLANGHVTLRHLIRRMSIVSDNRAFNRLYEFSGHRFLNESMWASGLSQTQFRHRLSRVLEEAQHRTTPAVEFTPPGKPLKLAGQVSDLEFPKRTATRQQIGDAFTKKGVRTETPMDFSVKNQMSLLDLQNMLIAIVRPDLDCGIKGFDLKADHRALLAKAMLELPGESKDPVWSAERYRADRFKPVTVGLANALPGRTFDVWNKAGRAYGFRVENAYVKDRKTGRSFFFTVAIYANANRTLNDGIYEYKTVTEPFMHALSEAVTRDLWG